MLGKVVAEFLRRALRFGGRLGVGPAMRPAGGELEGVPRQLPGRAFEAVGGDVAQHVLGGGAAADVAGADQQHAFDGGGHDLVARDRALAQNLEGRPLARDHGGSDTAFRTPRVEQ